jgi:hypothetical protein
LQRDAGLRKKVVIGQGVSLIPRPWFVSL